MKTLLYVGIDVDDNSYNVGCYCPESGQSTTFRCTPEKTAEKELPHQNMPRSYIRRLFFAQIFGK